MGAKRTKSSSIPLPIRFLHNLPVIGMPLVKGEERDRTAFFSEEQRLGRNKPLFLACVSYPDGIDADSVDQIRLTITDFQGADVDLAIEGVMGERAFLGAVLPFADASSTRERDLIVIKTGAKILQRS